MTEPKDGDLMVWHIPQVPGKPFYVPVKDIREAKLVDKILCDYDRFELANRVKGEFCNAGGLNVYCNGKWETWYSEEGDDFDDVDETGKVPEESE